MVLCAGAFGCYAAQGSLPGAQGQGYDLNLSYSRTTLKAVADAITQQVGIAFSYETALAGYPMENLEVSEKGATIEAILAAVFTPRGIDYRVVDKVVVLTRSTRVRMSWELKVRSQSYALNNLHTFSIPFSDHHGGDQTFVL